MVTGNLVWKTHHKEWLSLLCPNACYIFIYLVKSYCISIELRKDEQQIQAENFKATMVIQARCRIGLDKD